MTRWMLVAAAFAALGGCGEAQTESDGIGVRVDGAKMRIVTERITREAWGEKWPFTVDEATLICVPRFRDLGVYFEVDGRAFAATGAAASVARQHGLDVIVDDKALRPVLLDVDDRDGSRLWAKSPAPDGWPEDEEWARVSIGPVITALFQIDGCRA